MKLIFMAHNEYILHLHSANSKLEQFHMVMLPELISSLEELLQQNSADFKEHLDAFFNLHTESLSRRLNEQQLIASKTKGLSFYSNNCQVLEKFSSSLKNLQCRPLHYFPPEGVRPNLRTYQVIAFLKVQNSPFILAIKCQRLYLFLFTSTLSSLWLNITS
ncbi:unnamed protein product [Dicrocoelium dendriticum]|nr:unnamed protein product [Dicrocoelium dendriticum]